MPKIFSYRFYVPDDANDANGHVNNIAYVQWMQDVAIRHSDAQGWTIDKYQQLGTSWVVRSHQIEYLQPAFAGEEIEILTWVCNMKRTRSMRRYRFFRCADRMPPARAETDWVYVDNVAGKPKKIDIAVSEAFDLVTPEEEP
ncbi:MAG: acyl-CoA thioesterase [Desulfuromonadales bacterium]|nr:acyl-CoA thioesterase [Desulfuromonadales bacterium]